MSTPRGKYGPNYDGLGDPQLITPEERAYRSQGRSVEVRQRRASRSPLIRALQAATDKALGGR